jgi:hypothetical protein
MTPAHFAKGHEPIEKEQRDKNGCSAVQSAAHHE